MARGAEHMKLRESETLELKRSTSELKEAVISIGAILNKHGRGTVYFGVEPRSYSWPAKGLAMI